MSGDDLRVEVVTGPVRRRSRPMAEKRRIVEEGMAPGETVAPLAVAAA